MAFLDDHLSTGVHCGQKNLSLRAYDTMSAAIDAENSNDPLHFLFLDKITEMATRFRLAFPGTCLYAVKANPEPAVLKLLWKAGIQHFDVASLREVERLAALLPEAQLYFMHPVKSRKAIRRAYELGVRHFSFDCLEELRKIRQETQDARDLCLHLRVAVSQYGAAYPLDNKFGATLGEAPLLLAHARQLACRLGVSFHVGSQCLDVNAFSKAIASIARMRESCGVDLDILNVGGGFPVPYPDMQPEPPETYIDHIQEACAEHGLGDLQLFCEPGRAMVAEAGAVAVRVELRRGQSLYLNDGTYGSLFDAGQSGWCFPVALYRSGGSRPWKDTALFQFYGPTCDSIDKMSGPFSLADDVREGDWIIFRNLGAYGHALQTRFNGFYSDTVVAVTSATDPRISGPEGR